MKLRRLVLPLVLLLTGVFAQDEPRVLTAREIVARWRDAAESRREPHPETARFKSVARESAGKVKITEWVTSSGDYRRVAKRKGGRLEVVLLADGGTLRDWDGAVRALAGSELECWRSIAFETKTLAFGPSGTMASAPVELGDDKRSYVLHATSPQGAPITWYVDAQTFLPVRATIRGCKLTTEFSDWREKNLVFTAFRARVKDGDSSEYQLERKDAKIDHGAKRFHPPTAR